MKEKFQRFVAFALVLGLTASLAFGSAYSPAHAQAENGILNDVGEGENRVLSTEWRTLNPGEQTTYQFAYDGEEQPITIWMNAVPADGAAFQIWTDERLQEAGEDPTTEPLGQGTAMTEGSGFTNWQGGSPEAETYFVVVTATGDQPARYLLNISSPALAAVQPGAIALAPVAPPAPTVDPNIAVVTTQLLNVREGPSTAFAVITTVPNGTQMNVLGRNATNTWLNVQLDDGTEGWVTRSLTNYALVSPNVVEPAVVPAATTAVTTTVVTTPTTGTGGATTSTGTTAIATTALAATALEEGWQVLGEGETDWYTFQYRGGGLPLTLWMDVDPFEGAVFTVVNEETAQALMAGAAPTVFNTVGRGQGNPVEPGYLFWQADFAEADTFYVMVEHPGTGDALYAIHALGPGVARAIEPAE